MSVYDPNDPLAQLDPSQVPHAAPDQMADVAPESPVVPVAELPTTGLYLPGENTSDLGVNVNQAPPAVGPTVSSSDSVRGTQNLKYNPATGKVDGDFQVVPGKTETTQVAQPTRTSSGASTSVSVSRSGPDEDWYNRLDSQSAASAKDQTKLLTERNQDAQSALANYGREAEANVAVTQELMAQYDDTAAAIENQRLQEIETTKAKVQEIHDLAKQEVTMEMEKWKMEREQLSRLIAMDPVTEMYKGFSGIGMNMTTAVGSYLTALGVQNDLGAQMNQWVDRAIQSHQNRIAGQKDKMTATEKAIAQVWDNSRNEQEARLKITQLGLQALDTKLEVEKLKTSSKIKRSQIKVKQAEVRMQIATNAYKQQAEYAKDFTSVRLMEAQRSAALAQASQARESAAFHKAQRESLQNKPPQTPEGIVPILRPDGTWEMRRAVVNNTAALTDLREKSAALGAAQSRAARLQAAWAQAKATGFRGTFKDYVKNNSAAAQEFTAMGLEWGKARLGSLTGGERELVQSTTGLSSGKFTEAAWTFMTSQLGFAEDMPTAQSSFVDMVVGDARRDYDNSVANTAVPLSDQERAALGDMEKRMNDTMRGESHSSQLQAGKAETGEDPLVRITRGIGELSGTNDVDDSNHNMQAVTSEIQRAQFRYNIAKRTMDSLRDIPTSTAYKNAEAAAKAEEDVLRRAADSLARFQVPDTQPGYQDLSLVKNPDQYGFDPNAKLTLDQVRLRASWATDTARSIYATLPRRTQEEAAKARKSGG